VVHSRSPSWLVPCRTGSATFRNAHHPGSWPTQLTAVWSLPLQSDSGGPTSISDAASIRRVRPTTSIPPSAFVAHVSPVPPPVRLPACPALRPGSVSGAVAITHAYCCLRVWEHGRPLLHAPYEAESLHFRSGLSVALSTLRRGRYLAQRKTRFLLAGWALAGKGIAPPGWMRLRLVALHKGV